MKAFCLDQQLIHESMTLRNPLTALLPEPLQAFIQDTKSQPCMTSRSYVKTTYHEHTAGQLCHPTSSANHLLVHYQYKDMGLSTYPE
jgi:hypothetical protein